MPLLSIPFPYFVQRHTMEEQSISRAIRGTVAERARISISLY